jgi:hypothetical protein
MSEHSQYSVLEHCANTLDVGTLSVLRVRALCQHSGCQSTSTSWPALCQHYELQHSQYSVLKHYVNTPAVEAFSALCTRVLCQHSCCRSTSTFYESTVSTTWLSEHFQYSVLEHCANIPVVRAQVHSVRALYQHLGCRSTFSTPCKSIVPTPWLSEHLQYSGQHYANTPVVGTLSVLRVRALCQHSGCRNTCSTPLSIMPTLRLSEHSQYSVLEHCANTLVVGTLSILRVRALCQHSGCQSTSTFCGSIVSTRQLSEHTQYFVLEHCANTPFVALPSALHIRAL